MGLVADFLSNLCSTKFALWDEVNPIVLPVFCQMGSIR
jgi:hypothetical protein